MGVLYDYFSAPSDDTAATVIDLVGGPRTTRSAPTDGRRFLGRRTPAVPAPSFPTVSGNGIDPVVQMGKLEELLTGVPYTEIMARERSGSTVAERDGGERLVLTMTDELRTALAEADSDHLSNVVLPWSQNEEFWGRGDPVILNGFLQDMSNLCQQAVGRDEKLYCWVCV